MAEPFYDEDGKRIKSPDVAHDLAEIEDTRGHTARIRTEGELAKKHQLRLEAEAGETRLGEKKAEFINYLFEKYPRAFEKVVDGKEREALIYVASKTDSMLPKPLLITRHGIVQFNHLDPAGFESIKQNLGEITDILAVGEIEGSLPEGLGVDGMYLRKVEEVVEKGRGGALVRPTTLNFSEEAPKLTRMKIDDDLGLKQEAEKMFVGKRS